MIPSSQIALTWPLLQFCPWCFGTGMASWSLLPEWIFTLSFCIWGIWEVGKCISSYLARHQVNIWAAWIVKKLWGLHHIVEIHLLCKNVRWIWNNQSSPSVYRKKSVKQTQISVTLTNPSAPALALVVPRQMNAESTLQTNFVFRKHIWYIKWHPVSFQFRLLFMLKSFWFGLFQ